MDSLHLRRLLQNQLVIMQALDYLLRNACETTEENIALRSALALAEGGTISEIQRVERKI